LRDELFSSNDEYMIDEIATFFGAATNTTTVAIYNALYYMKMNP
jgi:cytochrome P450